MINTLKFKPQNMRRFLKDGYILATDIADYLVKKGEAFRDAHAITAKLVNYAIGENKKLDQLSLKEYKKLSPHFSKDVFDINLKSSIASRDNIGGTSLKQVNQALKAARKNISE
ncbi:MAG: hypothetical protein IZT57_02530 [Chloroflexi bacterium]|nr:hypothetical protein [Chloroflexota bacterium]